jgi:hypothetical protein
MTHPKKISLFKYFVDRPPVIAVDGSTKPDLEEHATVKAHVATCAECAEYGLFLEKLARGIKELRKEGLAPGTPCPDSWALAAYITGDIDQDAARDINAHIGFCDRCLETYLSLADERELASFFADEEADAVQAASDLGVS